jgi:hypothetical protein
MTQLREAGSEFKQAATKEGGLADVGKALVKGAGAVLPTLGDAAYNFGQSKLLGKPVTAAKEVLFGVAPVLNKPAELTEDILVAIPAAVMTYKWARDQGMSGVEARDMSEKAGDIAAKKLGLGSIAYTLAYEQATSGGAFADVSPEAARRAKAAAQMAEDGATREEIAAAVGMPLVEAIGQTVLDPMNLITGGTAGAAARRTAKETRESLYYVTRIDDAMDAVRGTMKDGKVMRPLGVLGRATEKISPRIPSAVAHIVQDDADAVLKSLRDVVGNDPKAFNEGITAMAKLAGTEDEVRSATRVLEGMNMGEIPFSRPGKQTSILIHDAMTDETGVVNYKMFDKLAEKATSVDEGVNALTRKYVDTIADMTGTKYVAGSFQDTRFLEANPIKRQLNKIYSGLATYAYLGYSPAFVARNIMYDGMLSMIDGNTKFWSLGSVEKFATDFGVVPARAAAGIGAGGYGKQAMITSYKELGPIPALKRVLTGNWKSGPMLELAGSAESYRGFLTWASGTDRAYRQMWKYGMAIPYNVTVERLPVKMRKWAMSEALSIKNIDDINRIKRDIDRSTYIATNLLDPDAMQVIDRIDGPFGDALRAAVYDVDTDTAVANIRRVYDEFDDFGAKAAMAPAVATDDIEGAFDLEIARTELGVERGDTLAERISQGRVQRDRSRTMVHGRIAEAGSPEVAQVINRLSDESHTLRLGTYEASNELYYRRIRKEITYGEEQAGKQALWDDFFKRQDEMWTKELEGLSDADTSILRAKQVEDARIDHAAYTKASADDVWGRKRAGLIDDEGAYKEIDELWLKHNERSVRDYDALWHELGGEPNKGPLAMVGYTPVQKDIPHLRQELALLAQEQGYKQIYFDVDGNMKHNPHLRNAINKEREAAGLDKIKNINELDEVGLQKAIDDIRGRPEVGAQKPKPKDIQVLRDELALLGQERGYKRFSVGKNGRISNNQHLRKAINKEREAAGLDAIKDINELDADGLQKAIDAIRSKPEIQGKPKKEFKPIEVPNRDAKMRGEEPWTIEDFLEEGEWDEAAMTADDYEEFANDQMEALHGIEEDSSMYEQWDFKGASVDELIRRGGGEYVPHGVGYADERDAILAELDRQADEKIREVLIKAGYDADTVVNKLAFGYKQRLLEEIAEKRLQRQKGGGFLRIPGTSVESRAAYLELVTPELQQIAKKELATMHMPYDSPGRYEVYMETMRRVDALREVEKIPADRMAASIADAEKLRAGYVEELVGATDDEVQLIQEAIDNIDTVLWALKRETKPGPARPLRSWEEGYVWKEIPFDAPPADAIPEHTAEEIIQHIEGSVREKEGVLPHRATMNTEKKEQLRAWVDMLEVEMREAAKTPLDKLSKEDAADLKVWFDSMKPRLTETKITAARAGVLERDFVLHNYNDRRLHDSLLSYFFMFNFWPTRTITNWGRRVANNPALATAYYRLMKAQQAMNQDLPEWARNNLKVNIGGNQLLFNVQQNFDPLYNATNSFHERRQGEKQVADLKRRLETETDPIIIKGIEKKIAVYERGMAMESLNDIGLGTVSPLAEWAHALSLLAMGDNEGALATVGYISQPSRAIHAATALAGIGPPGGIVLEPHLWQQKPFQGGDIYERDRVPRALYSMYQKGEISLEEFVDATYSRKGPIYEKGMQIAGAARAPGTLAGTVLGLGFRPYTVQDIEMSIADDEYYNIVSHWDDYTDEQRSELLTAHDLAYPWHVGVRMGRKWGDEKDSAMVWMALQRIPPGSKLGTTARETAMINDKLLDQWYSTGSFEGWPDSEKMIFLGGILKASETFKIPDIPTRQEWDDVKKRKRLLDTRVNTKYPEYQSMNENYFSLKEQSEDQAKAYLIDNPKLTDAWDYMRDEMLKDDLLFSYYGKPDAADQQAKDWLRNQMTTKYGEDIFEVYQEYLDAPAAARTIIGDERPDIYDFMTEYSTGKDTLRVYPAKGPDLAPKDVQLRQQLVATTEQPQSVAPVGVMPQISAENVEQWRPLIESNAKAVGIDPRIIATVIQVESGGDPYAMGKDKDTGLMQIVAKESGYSWAQNRPTQAELFNPDDNVALGSKMLAALISKNGGDVRKALAEYNSGSPDVNSEKGRRYLKLYDAAWENLWGNETAAAPSGNYIERMTGAMGNPVKWEFQHGTQDSLHKQVRSTMYDYLEEQYPGAGEDWDKYYTLRDAGGDYKAYLKARPYMTEYVDRKNAMQDWMAENPLMPGGTDNQLEAYLTMLFSQRGDVEPEWGRDAKTQQFWRMPPRTKAGPKAARARSYGGRSGGGGKKKAATTKTTAAKQISESQWWYEWQKQHHGGTEFFWRM